MPEPRDIDALIETGQYELGFAEGHGLDFQLGDELGYQVLSAGEEAELRIPVRIRITSPARYAGREVDAYLRLSLSSLLGPRGVLS